MEDDATGREEILKCKIFPLPNMVILKAKGFVCKAICSVRNNFRFPCHYLEYLRSAFAKTDLLGGSYLPNGHACIIRVRFEVHLGKYSFTVRSSSLFLRLEKELNRREECFFKGSFINSFFPRTEVIGKTCALKFTDMISF